MLNTLNIIPYAIIKKENISCNYTTEKLNTKDELILKFFKDRVYRVNNIIIPSIASSVLFILFFGWFSDNSTKNNFFELDNIFFICTLFAFFELLIIIYFFKKRNDYKREYTDINTEFDKGIKEVYKTKSTKSEFGIGTEYDGSSYKVKLEGFLEEIYIHESKIPQIPGEEFLVERLPISGIIVAIKNTKLI